MCIVVCVAGCVAVRVAACVAVRVVVCVAVCESHSRNATTAEREVEMYSTVRVLQCVLQLVLQCVM